MTNTQSSNIAAVHRHKHRPKKLIENRTIYASRLAELAVYDTYEQAKRVRLNAGELLYCGMMTGRKVMHSSDNTATTFLPHESFVVAPGEYVDIDFPEASIAHPTTCMTLEIPRETLRKVCDQLNTVSRRSNSIGEWHAESQPLHLVHTDATQQLLERIVSSHVAHEDDCDLVLDFGVNELVARMLRQQGRDFLLRCVQENPTQTGLTHVLSYIEENLSNHINIEELTKAGCMSRSKLYEQFRTSLGCSPMEYQQQRRLEKASRLIRSGTSITSASYELGFANPSHFSRRFQQLYGMTPREYASRN
ncbi:MAG: AraC family transcriptional regulator N-terminal domain-containing protein [Oleibacter sp.]|nr:AraC family transcriptional regulator N-terminal domain-containing protein [Thalassolituus sp.]